MKPINSVNLDDIASRCISQVGGTNFDLFARMKGKHRMHVIRTSLDWQTVYYNHTVRPTVYPRLTDGLTIKVAGESLMFLATPRPYSVVLQCPHGIYIKVMDPKRFPPWYEPDDDGKRKGPKNYPVEVQFQGVFFGAGLSAHMAEALSAIEDAIDVRIWSRNRDGVDYRDVTDAERIPARMDLCADVWFQDMDGMTAIQAYKALVCRGARDVIQDTYVCRAKKGEVRARLVEQSNARKPTSNDVRVISDARNNITIYIGSMIQMRIYRKDADFEGNTKNLLYDEWRASGWDGTGVVARVEFQISRAAMRLRQFVASDGTLFDGKNISLSSLHRFVESFWLYCLQAYRHCPPYEGMPTKRSRRKESAVWTLLRENPPKLESIQKIAEIKYATREFDVECLLDRTLTGLIGVQEAFGVKKPWELVELAESDVALVEEKRRKSKWRGYQFKRKKVEKTDARECRECSQPNEFQREPFGERYVTNGRQAFHVPDEKNL